MCSVFCQVPEEVKSNFHILQELIFYLSQQHMNNSGKFSTKLVDS